MKVSALIFSMISIFATAAKADLLPPPELSWASVAVGINKQNKNVIEGSTQIQTNLSLRLGSAWGITPEIGSRVNVAGGGEMNIISLNGHLLALPTGVVLVGKHDSNLFYIPHSGWSPITHLTAGVDVAYMLSNDVFIRGGITTFQKEVDGAKHMVRLGFMTPF